MYTIDKLLRIYQIDPGELTMRQVRKYFGSWDDEITLDAFEMLYDNATDLVLVGPKASEAQIRLCQRALSATPSRAIKKLDDIQKQLQLPAYKEVVDVIKAAVLSRAERTAIKEEVSNPNSKFICIDGDIFQISKIVSIKRRNDGDRYYIEFYITDKRASVKKEFCTKQLRDSEFQRIQKTLTSVT